MTTPPSTREESDPCSPSDSGSLEKTLQDIAASSLLTTMLSSATGGAMAEPAIGLLEIAAGDSERVPPSMVFRADRAPGGGDPPLLSVVGDDHWRHPWTVRRVVLLPEAEDSASTAEEPPLHSSSGRRQLAVHRIQVDLARPDTPSDTSRARPGPLNLYFRCAPALLGALERARCTVDGERTRFGLLPLPISITSLAPVMGGSVLDRLSAQAMQLARVFLPRAGCARSILHLTIHLDAPVLLHSSADAPEVRTNVVPAWNALPLRYPRTWDAEQVLAEGKHRFVHPLTSALPNSGGWRPFAILRIGAADDDRLTFGYGTESSSGYLLACLPASLREDRRTVADRAGTVAVVLTPEARERLDDVGARLVIEFLATTGRMANRLPIALVFTPKDAIGPRFVAELVAPTWGGTDGLTADMVRELAALGPHAMRGSAAHRSITEIVRAFDHHFSDALELVDQRDFLRVVSPGGAPDLTVRVRFRDSDASPDRRWPHLTACSSYLTRLVGSRVRVRLVELADD